MRAAVELLGCLPLCRKKSLEKLLLLLLLRVVCREVLEWVLTAGVGCAARTQTPQRATTAVRLDACVQKAAEMWHHLIKAHQARPKGCVAVGCHSHACQCWVVR